MTLIVGIKCGEGVLLVGDRKMRDEYKKISYDTKLDADQNIGLIMGASGLDHLYDRFKRKLPHTVGETKRHIDLINHAWERHYDVEFQQTKPQQSDAPKETVVESVSGKNVETPEKTAKSSTGFAPIKQYTYEDFLENCRLIIKELCANEDGYTYDNINLLVSLYDPSHGPRLHYIDFAGEEKKKDFHAIGSGGALANIILNRFLTRGQLPNVEYALKLAHFCIFFVQDLGFDEDVGVEENKFGDNYFLFNNGTIDKLIFKKEKQAHKEIKNMVTNFNEVISSLKF